jgi:hypothetical protein
MSKCPYCKQEIKIKDVKRETLGAGFLKQEIMYSCPVCDTIIGFSRGNYH